MCQSGEKKGSNSAMLSKVQINRGRHDVYMSLVLQESGNQQERDLGDHYPNKIKKVKKDIYIYIYIYLRGVL